MLRRIARVLRGFFQPVPDDTPVSLKFMIDYTRRAQNAALDREDWWTLTSR